MVKKYQTFIKLLVRMISKTKSRFISIFVITLVGSAFFTGLRISPTVMNNTTDAYLDKQNYADLTLIPTYGVTDEDIKELKKKKIGFVSFGCGKNVVEIEKIISKCKDFGFTIVSDEKEANILVVNSCAFLKSTRKESFDCIKDFAELKKYNLKNCTYDSGLVALYFPERGKE